jgi:hypothetical protein
VVSSKGGQKLARCSGIWDGDRLTRHREAKAVEVNQIPARIQLDRTIQTQDETRAAARTGVSIHNGTLDAPSPGLPQ